MDTSMGANQNKALNGSKSPKKNLPNWISMGKVEMLAPSNLNEKVIRTLMTEDCVDFLCKLVMKFRDEVEMMLHRRKARRLEYILDPSKVPKFDDSECARKIKDEDWEVWAIPDSVQDRKIDLGDVCPGDREAFINATLSLASGIQVDFDDGNCPTWTNQLNGLFNIYQLIHGEIEDTPTMKEAPILMIRPRAWNMAEKNFLVNGRQIPGALLDFGVFVFHNGAILEKNGIGPFFYLPKLEDASEAKLWDDIFSWAENTLNMEEGTIKACVLIENILAAFQMEEILYNLQKHSLGLNAGIWDYAASLISVLGHRKEFIFPERDGNITMEKKFINNYMKLMIQTCHRRSAPATAGMSPVILNTIENKVTLQKTVDNIIKSKHMEIAMGFDGFLLYDKELIVQMKPIFETIGMSENQINEVGLEDFNAEVKDLLEVPVGRVTISGLKHNIAVGVRFIEAWFKGHGTFVFKSSIEDSATAEISILQVRQWLQHGVKLPDMNCEITRNLIHETIKEFLVGMFHQVAYVMDSKNRELLTKAALVFESLMVRNEYPDFVTSYLYEKLEEFDIKDMAHKLNN